MEKLHFETTNKTYEIDFAFDDSDKNDLKLIYSTYFKDEGDTDSDVSTFSDRHWSDTGEWIEETLKSIMSKILSRQMDWNMEELSETAKDLAGFYSKVLNLLSDYVYYMR